MKPGKLILQTPSVTSEQKEFHRAANSLDGLIAKRNTTLKWEACVRNFGWQKKNGTMDKFDASNGQDLLRNILPNTDNEFSIFQLKKDGFAINNKHHDNQEGDEWYYILPACRDGFHRDWWHDGICVQDRPKKEE